MPTVMNATVTTMMATTSTMMMIMTTTAMMTTTTAVMTVSAVMVMSARNDDNDYSCTPKQVGFACCGRPRGPRRQRG
eukprot:2322136-Lingulodinium_polyedra.AAC.1